MPRGAGERLSKTIKLESIDLAASLRIEKKRLLAQIDALFDPAIAAAELARSQQFPRRGKGRSTVPLLGYGEMTAQCAIIAAMRDNGGVATIPEILRILGKRHRINHRAKPGKAVSKILGELRARGDVVKTADNRFRIRGPQKR